MLERIHSVGKQAGLCLPYVLRENSSDAIEKTGRKDETGGI
ncbi:MAG: hypothetical protein V8R80_02425 [Eubacterium sp.]